MKQGKEWCPGGKLFNQDQSMIVAFGGWFELTKEDLSILDLLPEDSNFDLIKMPNLRCHKFATSGNPQIFSTFQCFERNLVMQSKQSYEN